MIRYSEQGNPGILDFDLSKGIEKVPIVIHKGESSNNLQAFDQPTHMSDRLESIPWSSWTGSLHYVGP